MRVVLVGGTGFIGRHVVRELRAAGHNVAVVHRGQTLPELEGVEHILAARGSLPRLQADVVVDTILSSAPQAREVLDKMDAPRLVALSSMDVYRACGILHGTEPGPPDPAPLTEDSPLRRAPAYPPDAIAALKGVFAWLDDAYDKVPVERVVMEHARVRGTVLRLPMVYGPGDPLHRLHPIVQRIDDRRPAILIDAAQAQWRGPRGYVENVAAAIALAAAGPRAAGRIYNVAEEARTELEWTQAVAGAAGWGGRILMTPAQLTPPHLKQPYNFAQDWAADSTRIRRELGYREPVPFEEALRRTIAWERANPAAGGGLHKFDYAAEDAAYRAACAAADAAM